MKSPLVFLLCVAGMAARADVVSHVHNAPGWLPNHAYAAGERVNAGAGWNGSSFVPYQPLAAYKAPAACTSAPAWPDAACNWQKLSDTDYVTLTGWGYDAPAWSAKSYAAAEIVVSGTPLTAYKAGDVCNSSIAPPTVDACQWQPLAPVIYTSGRSFIPPQTLNPASPNNDYVHITQIYQANLWADREYVLGQGNELNFILQNHDDHKNDSLLPVYDVGFAAAGYQRRNIPIIVTAAAGESFRDRLAADASLPLGGYSPANGVAIKGEIQVEDNAVTFSRLQVQSSARAITMNSRGCNMCIADGNLLDAVGMPTHFGAGSVLANNLMLVRGANAYGAYHLYSGVAAHNTIISPDKNGGACFMTNWDWIFPGMYVLDNACFGFQHFAVSWANIPCPDWQCVSWHSKTNVTDAPQEPFGVQTNLRIDNTDPNSQQVYTSVVPDVVYGASASMAFVAWGSDYRPAAGGPIKNAGALFGTIPTICPYKDNLQPGEPSIPAGTCTFNPDTRDISNAPWSTGAIDIGAVQAAGDIVPPPPPPGASFPNPKPCSMCPCGCPGESP